jgi:hypothetical protein
LGNGSYGQVFQGVYLNAQVAIKVLNIDYDDPAGAVNGFLSCKCNITGLSDEILLRFRAKVDFQRKLSYKQLMFRTRCQQHPAGYQPVSCCIFACRTLANLPVTKPHPAPCCPPKTLQASQLKPCCASKPKWTSSASCHTTQT